MRDRKQRKHTTPKERRLKKPPKRRIKKPHRRTKNGGPQTARQYFSKPKRFQDTWDLVAQVISKMRSSRISLRKAAREFGIDPDQVINLGRLALRKQRNGRYSAKKTDRLLRVLGVLISEGKREIALRDSRQASVVGSHWDAVQRYLQTGDDSALRKFQRKKIIDASKKRHLLLTNLDELNRLGSAGVLSFESLYGRSA
jgi:hypothetical protein